MTKGKIGNDTSNEASKKKRDAKTNTRDKNTRKKKRKSSDKKRCKKIGIANQILKGETFSKPIKNRIFGNERKKNGISFRKSREKSALFFEGDTNDRIPEIKRTAKSRKGSQ